MFKNRKIKIENVCIDNINRCWKCNVYLAGIGDIGKFIKIDNRFESNINSKDEERENRSM